MSSLSLIGSNSTKKIRFHFPSLSLLSLIGTFSEELKKRYEIELHMMDERLTTKEAIERIHNKPDGIKDSANKHSISAQIILEDWFRSID